MNIHLIAQIGFIALLDIVVLWKTNDIIIMFACAFIAMQYAFSIKNEAIQNIKDKMPKIDFEHIPPNATIYKGKYEK